MGSIGLETHVIHFPIHDTRTNAFYSGAAVLGPCYAHGFAEQMEKDEHLALTVLASYDCLSCRIDIRGASPEDPNPLSAPSGFASGSRASSRPATSTGRRRSCAGRWPCCGKWVGPPRAEHVPT